MSNELKKAAEILVASGYFEQALDFETKEDIGFFVKVSPSHKRRVKWRNQDQLPRFVEPFDDTLEGRRQADAIEDWLSRHHRNLWVMGSENYMNVRPDFNGTFHQWRLDRIKWCLERLAGDQQ